MIPVFHNKQVQKSISMVMQLQRELDDSPSRKAKHEKKTKNEILELC